MKPRTQDNERHTNGGGHQMQCAGGGMPVEQDGRTVSRCLVQSWRTSRRRAEATVAAAK
jgi:hypothetical protein